MKKRQPILPSFFQESSQKMRECAHTGCTLAGDFKAPRSRQNLQDYIWLCLIHVREYNEKWNYYAGMDIHEIEQDRKFDETWQRPTWPFAQQVNRQKMKRAFHQEEAFSPKEYFRSSSPGMDAIPYTKLTSIEKNALAIMNISYPFEQQELKKNYLMLAKKYHPDANGGSKEAEEYLKKINQSYDILKKIIF